MAPSNPLIYAIILAAGSSKRFPGTNKLLAPVHGVPIIQRVTTAICEANTKTTLVITGKDHALTKPLLASQNLQCIQNRDYSQGMGTSLTKGIDSIPEDNWDGILICLGDLPNLTTKLVNTLIQTFQAENANSIIIPIHQGRRGHPIIFPYRYRNQLSQLTGDKGARDILKKERNAITELEVDTPAIFQDIDRPEDLSKLNA